MQLGANVIISTARAASASAPGNAAPAQPYLRGVIAYMRVLPATEYMKLPPNIMSLDNLYEARVDPDVDILEYDRLTSVTELDGVTPWPPTLTGALGTSYSWVVRYVRPANPAILPSRRCYIQLQQVAR